MRKFLPVIVLASLAWSQTPIKGSQVVVTGSGNIFVFVAKTIAISPSSSGAPAGTNVQYTALFIDQFGNSSPACVSSGWSSTNTAAATINASTGLATTVAAGSTTISCAALSLTGSTSLTVELAPAFSTPLQATCSNPCILPAGAAGSPYNYTTLAGGGTAPYTFSIASGSPPNGITYGSNGVFSGTPSASGTTAFSIQACDSLTLCSAIFPVSILIQASNTFGWPNYTGSTTSTLAQNKVAGCNANVASGFCGHKSGANQPATAYSVSSGVLCVTVPNVGSDTLSTAAFNSGEIVGLSGATTAPVNGLILTTNGSTSATQVCGTLANTQGAIVTPVNSSGSETTIYMQGQGWQPFMLAPFPAPGNTVCPNGNATTINPSGTAATCLTPATTGAALSGINTWAFDWSIPGGSLNSSPNNCMTQLMDTSFNNGQDYTPSLTSSSDESNISLDDTASGYFLAFIAGGASFIGHVHINPTLCNGLPGLVSDVIKIANTNKIVNINYGAFSRGTRPGVNQALRYYIDFTNVYAPVLKKVVLTYSSGAVTAGTPTSLFNINTCPAFSQQPAGNVIAAQMRADVNDRYVGMSWGFGNQNSYGRHTYYIVDLVGSTCTTLDASGYQGSGVTIPTGGNTFGGSWAGVTGFVPSPFQSAGTGTGYVVNDTFSVPCGATGKVTKVSAGGAISGAISLTAGTGCTLGDAVTVTGGSGSGGKVGINSLGQPTNYTYYWNGSSTAVVPTFTYSPNCPTPCALIPIAIHSGQLDQGGTYQSFGGWNNSGTGSGPGFACSGCADVYFNESNASTFVQTNPSNSGHRSYSIGLVAPVVNPLISLVILPDINCVTPSNCKTLYNFSGLNQQFHMWWPSPGSVTTGPIGGNSSFNGPPVTNPPAVTGPYGISAIAIPQTGAISWFAHFYVNANNNSTENINTVQAITSFSPDGAWLLTVTDGNCGFTGNVSLGNDAAGACFQALVGVMLN